MVTSMEKIKKEEPNVGVVKKVIWIRVDRWVRKGESYRIDPPPPPAI
jgi:hypothetical protein